MRINKIALENFRNYETQEINLEENINVFYGNMIVMFIVLAVITLLPMVYSYIIYKKNKE